ncbi:MAG: hypothetical protein RR131_08245 [Anaerovorax sp.]
MTGETVFDKNLKAPIAKMEKIGEFIVFQNGKEVNRYPLLAEDEVKAAGLTELYIRMLREGVQ